MEGESEEEFREFGAGGGVIDRYQIKISIIELGRG